jgi:hypothetical protein
MTKMIIKAKANKMVNADVQFISLVDRGANRIPFKIIKQEKNMSKSFVGLDLGSIFARKSEDQDARIVGIATMGGEGLTHVSKQLEEAGFSVSDMLDMEDGSIVFKQSDETLDGDATIIKINDNLAIVTKGFSPYSMDIAYDSKGGNGLSFSEAVTTQGFYPGISTILDVIRSSISSAMGEAKTPAESASAIASLYDEAKKYTLSFINNLPAKAFKLETLDMVAKDDGADYEEEEDFDAEAAKLAAEVDLEQKPDRVIDMNNDNTDKDLQTINSEDVGTIEELESIIKAAMSADEKTYMATLTGADKFKFMKGTTEERAAMMKGAAKDTTTKTDETILTPEAFASIFATQMEALTATLSKKMDESIAAAVGIVDQKVTTLTDTLDTLNTRVGEAESVSKAAKEAITGVTVTGSDTGDDDTTTRKTDHKVVDGSFGGREIDTAFMGNQVRKQSRHR